jgi:hypothetical protein
LTIYSDALIIGLVEKLPNHVENWGSCNAIRVCGSWIIAAGYDLDSGQGYLTVRSVNDNSYVATVSCPSCPKIECLCDTGDTVGWKWCTGGKKLLVWDWFNVEGKPKQTRYGDCRIKLLQERLLCPYLNIPHNFNHR